MADYVRPIRLGSATVTVINDGVGTWDLAQNMDVPESEWRPRYREFFEQPVTLHYHCVHIAVPGASILVDAGFDDPSPTSQWMPPRIQRSPGIVAGLAEIGVRPEDVTHLVVTHVHGDHFAGATVERGGQYEPRFPRARCYVGRAEWIGNPAREDPNSLLSRTLGVLERGGLLELVEGDRDLVPGVRVIASPGETPGHLSVRVSADGQTLYCLGDLYHHPVEVVEPTWVPHRRDPAAALVSRRALADAALAENGLLVAAHIASIGRLQRTADGVAWVPVTDAG